MTHQLFGSIPEMFQYRVSATPDSEAFRYPTGSGWASLTWKQAGERVRDFAAGLLALGLDREQRVAIVGTTRVEWILADLAILTAGGATTTVYPSNTAAECEYILNDSKARLVFAENRAQLAKLLEIQSRIPHVENVIVFEDDGTQAGGNGWVLSLDDLAVRGRTLLEKAPEELEKLAKEIAPDHLATLIYTSGTTGQPKGVELTHDCWAYEGYAIAKLDILSMEDLQYLWLPLSHAFGKVLQAAQIQVGFPTAVDGNVGRLVSNLAIVKPTFMAAAPRIFEKVYNKVVQGVEEAGGAKRLIFRKATEVGTKVSRLRQAGKEPGLLTLAGYSIADKLVFSKLRERFGGRIRFFISGSAPLSLEMAEFFHAANILILEGYGLTESSAASFVNRPNAYRFGTVGKPLEGLEVKIDGGDSEILIRGRGIMRGYHGKPEATAEALTPDGWLRTGDIGNVDEQGFLRITDRKKDLIKTSGGKYVAPQKIEGTLKALCPYLSQVLVHGNNRNFITALVSLDEEGIVPWAKDKGLGTTAPADLAKAEPVIRLVQDAVDRLNQSLASYETIKKFAILPKDLTVEDGELTPSLKVKRKVVETKYGDMIEKFYSGSIRRV